MNLKKLTFIISFAANFSDDFYYNLYHMMNVISNNRCIFEKKSFMNKNGRKWMFQMNETRGIVILLYNPEKTATLKQTLNGKNSFEKNRLHLPSIFFCFNRLQPNIFPDLMFCI